MNPHILDIVETWAKSKGWWTYCQHAMTPDRKEDGYLNIAKHDPWAHNTNMRVITLWADMRWQMNGEYPDNDNQKLEPADPDFFLNLEYLIITKTR
jgi:hypothetical protein